MRIDFSSQQYRGDDEQRLIRLMRAARAVAGTLFVAGLAVVAFKSPPPAAEPAPSVMSTVELEVGSDRVNIPHAECCEPYCIPLAAGPR